MKRLIALSMIIVVLGGCGYGMRFMKSVPSLPSNISNLKVEEIEDKRMGKQEPYIERGSFVRNILINELRNSKRFGVDDNSPYHLIVKIEDYNASYQKYIALSAQVLDTSTNQIIWNASISGQSKKTIDEVTQNVVKEMVKSMVGTATGQRTI
jgi:hypothetical protein